MQPLLHWKDTNYYILWVHVCSVRHPECNEHTPYCYLLPAQLYNISPHYLINETTMNMKCVFDFLYNFVWNISQYKKNWVRCDQKCTLVLVLRIRYPCPILMKPEFSCRIFKNIQISIFHENPSRWSWTEPCRQTGGQSWQTY